MPVPLLPLAAAGVTGLAGLSFVSVLPEDPIEDAGLPSLPTSTNPDPDMTGGGGANLSLITQAAVFIAILVFGNTILRELL